MYLSNVEEAEPFFIKMHPADNFDTSYRSVKQTPEYGIKATVVNADIFQTEKWMYAPEPEENEENEEKTEKTTKKSKKTKKKPSE